MLYLLILGLLVGLTQCNDFSDIVFGRSSLDGVPAAFGDFNSDEITDIFFLQDYDR